MAVRFLRSFQKYKNMANKILFLILLLFVTTRLYQIQTIPASVYWDEASIGVNAYSILTSAKDEWGDFLPVHFRAFGEFKLPVYIYSTAITVGVFGLNEFAVRLPAVIFSLGSLILIYLIAGKIFNNKLISLFTTFYFTISPWYFLFSRTGYELTAGIFFYLLGIYFLLITRENKRFFLTFSAISFILTLYSYNSFRIVTPVTLVLLSIVMILKLKKQLFNYKIELLFSGGFIILSLIPIIRLFLLDAGATRLGSVGINDSNWVMGFIKNFFSHFNIDYLFVYGDKNLRSHVFGIGQLFWIDLPLLIFSFIYVLKSRNYLYFLIPLIFLVGFIPSSITNEAPHALRSAAAIPFLALLVSVGLNYFITIFKNKYLIYPVIAFYLVLFLLYFGNFIKNYSYFSATEWQYPYKKIFTDYKSKFGEFDKIYVSEKLAQPYIFSLFYSKDDIKSYQESLQYNLYDKWGFSKVKSYGKFIFSTDQLLEFQNQKLLIFAPPEETISLGNKISTVDDLSGNLVFNVYEYKP